MSVWKKIGIGAAIITGVAPLLGIEAPAAVKTIAQFNSLHNKTNTALNLFNKANKTNYTLEGLFNQVTNMESADQKLINALPRGHPQVRDRSFPTREVHPDWSRPLALPRRASGSRLSGYRLGP